jgi:hypothetical protein
LLLWKGVVTDGGSRIQEAPRTIQPRIELEIRQREDMRRAQAAELLGIYVGSAKEIFLSCPRANIMQPNTPQASTSGNTPAMSSEYRQAPQQLPHPPRLVEAPPTSAPRFEYETAEVEEKDYEMTDK